MHTCALAEVAPAAIRLVDGASHVAGCTGFIADAELAAYSWTAGVSSLANALVEDNALRLSSLELRNMPLDKHSLRALSGALTCRRGARLRSLTLHNNGLRASDMPALVALLDAAPSVSSLRVVSNSLSNDGGQLLHQRHARPSLRALEFTDAVDAAGMRALLCGAVGPCGGHMPPGASPRCLNLTISSWRRERRAGGREHGVPPLPPVVRALRAVLGNLSASTARPAHQAAREIVGRGRLALGLQGNGLGDRGAVRLASLLVRLFTRDQTIGPPAPAASPTTAAASAAPIASRGASSRDLWTLDLRANGIGDAGALALASAAAQLPHLRRLDLGENPVGPRGFSALLSLALGHPSLSHLRMPIGNGLVAMPSTFAATLAAKGLIDAAAVGGDDGDDDDDDGDGGGDDDDDDAEAAAEAAASPTGGVAAPRLVSAPAPWPHADERSVEAALGMLGGGSSLRVLEVPRWDVLSPRAPAALLDALRRRGCGKTASIDLRGAMLDPAAAGTLAEVLAHPACGVASVQLASNALPVRSVVRIARALSNNTAVRSLNIAHNNVGSSGARALIAAAVSAGALVDVIVTNGGVGTKWQAALIHATRRNREAQRAARRHAELHPQKRTVWC